VVRFDERRALVQTVDFFPPIVDDAYAFGAIAAANSLSDVYAMGGQPLSVLNLAAFPEGFDPEVIGAILRGGADKVKEAGAVTAGGHTIRSDQILFGMSVTGVIDPDRIVSNAGARPGDLLYLTKPLGMGSITTAGKLGKIEPREMEAACVVMATLNRTGAEAMVAHGAHGATDITGFGFLGHTADMARLSGVTFRIRAGALPFQAPSRDLASRGILSGGAARTRKYLGGRVREGKIPREVSDLAYDAETSGGLFISLPAGAAKAFRASLEGKVPVCEQVGEVVEAAGADILLEP
ncbi:MAG: selenide, water dikinase SelD, partial [Planctomycetes bacterium]|nr:selenide, water dikinase SelD [Planctomycetota bacterium]